MGMSASQARFLSLTARIHDIEYQAPTLENAKLSLTNDSNMAYDEYCEGLNATTYKMKVVSGGEVDKVNVTFAALLASGNQPYHPMYILTDAVTNDIYLPEQVVNAINGKIPENLETFLQLVGTNYVYSGEGLNAAEARQKLAADGYADYWTAVYYQLAGYTDNDGKVYNGHGMISVSNYSANDTEWIEHKIERGEAILNVMESTEASVGDEKVNIFAERNIATDTNLSMETDDLTVLKAQAEYENKMDNINAKDKQLDLQLSKLENERNALKTEYDTVKDLIKKNIEKSYKTFNA